jgi:putative acetyltransferase
MGHLAVMSTPFASANEPVRVRAENVVSDTERRAIRLVHEAAFGGVEEADLVDRLRGTDSLVSLVAEERDSDIVGHALFSRIWIQTATGRVRAVSLAPVAVRPEYQRQGIGQRLIREGLTILMQRDERIVIVVGHPSYYAQLGFSSEKAALLESPFPREVFMALELIEGALTGVQGVVVYPPPFGL